MGWRHSIIPIGMWGGSLAVVLGKWQNLKLLQHSSKKKKKTKEMKKKQRKKKSLHRLIGTDIPFFSFGVRPLNILLNRLSVCKRRTKGVLVGGSSIAATRFFRCFCLVSVPLFLNLLAAAAADDGAPLQLAGAGDERLIHAVSRTIRCFNT